ncbi:FAD-binding oxidoreductase [Candidatus Nomurabacteria bacterium]|nr:FAD-binding oxidoreductase [Candidatus Nomurabacteria bacterium]
MKSEIKKFFKGDVEDTPEVLDTYSHDASLFEVRPELVVFPKDSTDIQNLVKWVTDNKDTQNNLSLTVRAAGTCMSGGAINESVIVDVSRYMNNIVSVDTLRAVVEPGVYYRDLEKETLKHEVLLPSYTASKDICAVGGMVGNNSGGEKTLKYGKTEQYIESLKIVLSDGYEYTIHAMTHRELTSAMNEATLLGQLYKKLYALIQENEKAIEYAKPNVSKNSAGYYLWNVWNKQTEVFDLCRLIVGSQGTLGIVTQITFRLVPVAPYENVLAIFMPDITRLGDIVKTIMPFGPDSLESYDDYSMKLAVRFFFDFFKQLGFWGAIKLGLRFIPEAWMMLTGGVPKLILLVEISGVSEQEVAEKLRKVQDAVKVFGYKTRIARNSAEAEKYWKIRRESFNMLRKHVQGKRTAPFIDDVIVSPSVLPEFLPKLEALIAEYNLVYTIAGHAGNGNFHIIPLMDLDSPLSGDVILDLSQKVYDLVLSYHGSITAEHNDGIIRTPYLGQMYGEHICGLFKEVKDMFDPKNIFNPGKKVGGTKEYLRAHLIKNDHSKEHGS